MEKPKLDEVFTEKINTALTYIEGRINYHDEVLTAHENTTEKRSNTWKKQVLANYGEMKESEGYIDGIDVVFQSFTDPIMYNYEFSDLYNKIAEIKSKYCEIHNRYFKLFSENKIF